MDALNRRRIPPLPTAGIAVASDVPRSCRVICSGFDERIQRGTFEEGIMKILMGAIAILAAALALPAFAGTPCDQVKAQIAKKIEAHGVKSYTLEAVAAADVKDRKVVGVCEGGTRKIVYQRGAAAAPATTEKPAAAAAKPAVKASTPQ
jgi:hypothetical protein